MAGYAQLLYRDRLDFSVSERSQCWALFLGGLMFDKLIRSKRRKTMAIEIESSGAVTVRAPTYTSERAINRFVKEAAPWIEKQQEKIRLRPRPETDRQFIDGELFLYQGDYYPLTIVDPNREPLRLFGEFQLSRAHQHLARSAFMHWYKRQAREKFTQRLVWYSKASGFEYHSLKLSSAKRSWGSCTHDGKINLSWRLIMAPPEVLDYIVVHELSHTQEHNHSKAFWAHVERLLPAYKDQQDWLRDFGQLLHL